MLEQANGVISTGKALLGQVKDMGKGVIIRQGNGVILTGYCVVKTGNLCN